MQISQHRNPHIGVGQPSRWFKALEHRESGGRFLPLGYRYCAVEFVNCGGCDLLENRVILHDFIPPRFLKRWCEAMFRRNPGFRVVAREDIALRRFG